MLFVLYCRDKPASQDLRLTTRPAHLEFARGQGAIKMAGPMFGDGHGADSDTMSGSLFVIEANDLAEAQAFNAADPYTKAGLWASVTIHPFRWLLPEGAAR